MRAAALLHAALQNGLARLRGLRQRLALAPAMQCRFFEVGVLVRSQRVLGNLDMQVIRSGNQHRIHVFAIQHLLVLDRNLGLGHVLFEPALKIGNLLVVNVGQRSDLALWDPAQNRRIR